MQTNTSIILPTLNNDGGRGWPRITVLTNASYKEEFNTQDPQLFSNAPSTPHSEMISPSVIPSVLLTISPFQKKCLHFLSQDSDSSSTLCIQFTHVYRAVYNSIQADLIGLNKRTVPVTGFNTLPILPHPFSSRETVFFFLSSQNLIQSCNDSVLISIARKCSDRTSTDQRFYYVQEFYLVHIPMETATVTEF